MVRVQNVTQEALLRVVVNFRCEAPVMSHDGPGASHIQGTGAFLYSTVLSFHTLDKES